MRPQSKRPDPQAAHLRPLALSAQFEPSSAPVPLAHLLACSGSGIMSKGRVLLDKQKDTGSLSYRRLFSPAYDEIERLLEQTKRITESYTKPLNDTLNDALKSYQRIQINIQKIIAESYSPILDRLDAFYESFQNDIFQLSSSAASASRVQSAFITAVDTEIESALDLIEQETGESDKISKFKEKTKRLSTSDRIAVIVFIIEILSALFFHIDDRVQSAAQNATEAESAQEISDKLEQLSSTVRDLNDILYELISRSDDSEPETQEYGDKDSPTDDADNPRDE